MRDEQLIAAIRAGDAAAKELLARRYYEELYAYFASRTGHDEAEDLTQVTLLHTVARVDRFREESSFRYYVFAVARRVLAERSRRSERRLDTEEPASSEPPASQTSPSERIFRAEYRERLLGAIAELEEHYRVVVDLYLRGANNFEIAESLELEYNTVRSRLSRGLTTVKQLLGSWASDRPRARSAAGELLPPGL